jgi:hypothetical protein
MEVAMALGTLLSVQSHSSETRLDWSLSKTNTSQSQVSKYGPLLHQLNNHHLHHLQHLLPHTMLKPTPRLASMFPQLGNQPTTPTQTTFQTLPLRDQANSLTPRMELVNGGKSTLIKDTGLTELESETERTAAEAD